MNPIHFKIFLIFYKDSPFIESYQAIADSGGFYFVANWIEMGYRDKCGSYFKKWMEKEFQVSLFKVKWQKCVIQTLRSDPLFLT